MGGLGRSGGLCWRSCAALGAYVGDLGPLLGPMLAVLGGLGAYVGGLGPLVEPMLAVLEHLGAEVVGLGAKSGPGPSGKAIWQGDQAGKWPKPEREGRSGEGTVLVFFRVPAPPVDFFL